MTEPIAHYFDDYNPELLPLIPPDAKVILEVGCGTGRLCEAYRRINPGVKWVGVEKNREAAEAAEDHGVEILGHDIAGWGIVFTPYHKMDCVIFGDVLEHLQDPWEVLRSVVPCLKPDAQILASVPNVQHWSVILDLLRGQWRYQDDGIFDRTHLRFFTLDTLKEMFRDAGLHVFEVRGRQIGFNQEAESMRDRLYASGLGEMFGGPDFRRQTQSYQYIVRAIRSDIAPSKLHIHAIGDGTCCERPRLHEPMAMLGTIPGVRCTTNRGDNLLKPGEQPQIIIQQRFRGLNLTYHQTLIERGILLIAEIDDDPEGLEGLPECDFLPLRAVHAIQTTTEVMAETCRKFNPHVMVFPNQIADLPPPREYEPRDCIRIFFGALNREKDWEPIMDALNRAIREQDVLFEVIHDQRFFQALKTASKRFTPYCQWPEYRKILRSCDIALLPLEDTRFNRHKSDIKFLECAAEGVTCLMSETAADQLPHPACNDAYRCYHDSSSFERALRILIEHTHGRQRTAEIAYAYVRNHRLLSQHYRRRHEWYIDLLNRKSELTRDLLARVPELDTPSTATRSVPAPAPPESARATSPA